jgi:probable F420-dependent oxidoreductase
MGAFKMQIGVVFPQYEIGADAGEIRAYTQGVEALGFDYIMVFDHVLGANTKSRPDWVGPYTLETMFHEPFALFGYMAGVSTKLGFSTGVLILPQRQTVLVAKQAAEVDVLCNGRFRLGVGTGWNHVEYEALNMSFADRGKVFEDQIEVMRALWTKPAVTLKTPYHTITDAGINPLPIQKPIPIWFGGGSKHPVWGTPGSEKVVRRIARLGDGWMPYSNPREEGPELMEKFRGYVREYGRDPNKIGIDGVVGTRGNEDEWVAIFDAWRKLGATHVAVTTMHDGLTGADQHLKRLQQAAKVLLTRR